MNRITDFQEGDSLPPIQLAPVTRLDLIKYAGASGDFNPIHTIDAEAEGAGLPGIIAHGMWTMGNLAKIFTPYLEEGFIQDYAIRFKGMVFLEDVITLKATVVEKKQRQVIFQVQAVNQSDKDVLKGDLVFLL
ncbi:MaoC/PaaZ C-terminal domain-containing protein [Planococcus sp. SE5232]|uniref:MaoC/PaaZ C-terminal domain-containing protein n=1 Tax=unclassified Planococcus (in: firmicutes) TaxID=2662419 RepID=UPI001CBE8748|nr:MaoC/PaaZ C-terminal domain-containing protein [Planococcus sp. 4-30]